MSPNIGHKLVMPQKLVDLSKSQEKSRGKSETLHTIASRRSIIRKRNFVVSILCVVNLFANSAYSSIAPFYPIEAVKKGVPSSTLGLIFASGTC
jgi:hypothetical protein